MNFITPQYLSECFDYNKNTGELFWKARPIHHFNGLKGQQTFNGQFAGKKLEEQIIAVISELLLVARRF